MVCDMMFICPLLDFSIHVIVSTPLLLLHYLTEKKKKKKKVIVPRGTCHWGWGLHPPLPPPLQILVTQIFGATREIWANQIFTKVSMFRFVFLCSLKEFFYFELKSAW